MACDAGGNLLIADSGNHRIQKFTTEGQFVETWGEFGDGEGQFNSPWGLALDRDGNVFVSDWGNHRIQKFTAGAENSWP